VGSQCLRSPAPVMSLVAKAYISIISATGLALFGWQMAQWHSELPSRYACYFIVGILASVFKLTLPAMAGTLSINFLFILFGVLELTLPETLLLACTITAVQSAWNPKRRAKWVQAVFNVGTIAVAATAAYFTFHSFSSVQVDTVIRLSFAAVVFFLLNTLPVAVVIALTERKRIPQVWSECFFWTLPYYLIGAAIAGLMSAAHRYVGWQTALLVIPIVYLIYRSYGHYLSRLEDERLHAEEMAALHLRTIEALALAIEAKDHTTSDHLGRVQVYSVEIGKELGLAGRELEALRAAALLHDIGKLAVPEHILSKPGRLTPEEFQKMKIHPVVGAEILERVRFPYDVVPIVRSHHERWNGTGYPDGLKEDAIPMGARILSAVDCLDALASERQYRPAMPLDQAMEQVASEAGAHFDPRVVEILNRRYREFEAMLNWEHQQVHLTRDIRVDNGRAPDAGFEKTAASREGEAATYFLESIAAARQEVQALFELAQDLGNSLSLDETLSVLAVRLRRMIPCDAVAIYIKRDEVLIPQYVAGEDFRLFSSLEIPMGQGLSGWVAENRKPIVNGNPSVEPGYLNDPSKFSKLRSALAIPLEGLTGVLGVLTLYQSERDAFTRDHLRILLAISSKVALSVDNALRYRQAEDSATIDYLTQLPNARSLFLHLDAELARARRAKAAVAVLVCDLDGFKLINDRYGHLEGNKLLRNVARGLREACREYDYVARMGGDEFVIVLPGLSRENVELRCEALRNVVIVAGRQICGADILNISIGSAFFLEDGEDAEELLAQADRRMYAEKQQSKIRTALARHAWEDLRVSSPLQ
jgi:diguanylate cyclase (GGDEF)-like protein/putative nucleotidyltransferase with HDIG domain